MVVIYLDFNFSIDSKVGDNDDLGNGSVINRLELAWRGDNDAESPIMTVVGSGATQRIVRRFQVSYPKEKI